MRKEKGAIVVEATIALSTFIFAIFMILSIVDMCFIQAKISLALNSAAKEISQYSYLYYAFNADNLDAKLSEGTGDSKKLAEDTIDGMGSFLNNMSDAQESMDSGNFDAMAQSIQGGASDVKTLVNSYGDAIGNNPKEFIVGMGKLAGSELKEEAKVVLAQVMAKAFMKKNLMSYPGDNADEFLKRNHVVDGMDGLDFNYTTFLAGGKSNVIQMVCTYQVKLIQLLNVDYKFTIRQCSKTTAWGNGVTKIANTSSPETGDQQNVAQPNEWDRKNDGQRGKNIIKEEQKKYPYGHSGNGYQAYDNRNGANEFVCITTIDTHEKSYPTASKLASRIKRSCAELQNGAGNLGQDIVVTDSSGSSHTLQSDPATRTYRVEIVVPDDADMTMVNEAINKAKEKYPNFTFDVHGGHGSPTPKPAEQPAEQPAPQPQAAA